MENSTGRWPSSRWNTLSYPGAVAELCRIVRPGGRVLIIDKHAAQQPLSLHQPWERWFQFEEIAGWLAPYCCDIDIRPISHGPGGKADGLFFAWEATRNAPASRQG